MTWRGVRVVASVLAATVTVSTATIPGAPLQRDTPALLVVVAVDQFRADYPDWYGAQWRRGLHRLFREGAVFPRATIPWAITKTCAGHASISTGALPARHGLIANDWFDRTAGAMVDCTSDPSARPIGFAGMRGVEHHSARHLLAPTLAEELRHQATSSPRTVVLASKARASIALAGRGGDSTIVAWQEEQSGAWATSSAFASSPWPEVDTYIAGHRPASPFDDVYLANLAIELVERVRLGQRNAIDLLVVGFSALDYAGHSFGPRGQEVQDTLLQLDEALGRLIDTLDRVVGRERYVLGFTSDHGVALLPEQAASLTGIPGGRLNPAAVATAVARVLGEALGPQRFIEAVTDIDIHLESSVLASIRREPGLANRVVAAVEAVPGVHRAFWRPDMEPASTGDDPGRKAFRASYVAGRSGDLTFTPALNWVVADSGTDHGSLHAYDRDVPLVFLGAGIKSNRHAGGTPLDLAPTLAAFAGITMPSAQGVSRRGRITR